MKKEINKKYWLLTSEYPPEYGGGIATYCLHNAQMLSKKGYEVSVFVCSETNKHEYISTEASVRVIRFNTAKKKLPYLGHETARSFQFAEILKKYMTQEGVPAILESQEYAGVAYFTLLYKHLNYDLFRELKVLLTLHAPAFLYYDYNRVPSYRLPYFWIGEMERWCIKAADRLNAPGQFLTDVIQPYFSTPLEKEITIIPYPFEQQTASLNFNADPRDKWFFFGKLTPQKGIIPLLRSYRNLWRSGWQKQLIVIGGGDHYFHPEHLSMTDWVKKTYTTEIQSAKLQLTGNLSPATWQKEISGGGIIIIPSIGDNYPFTVLESMSNGQIVLASKQGGQRELIRHGKNGFLFDHMIKGDLEEKIRLIDNLSLEEINTIRKAAVCSVAEKHAYEKVFSLKEKTIKQLINENTIKDQFPFTRQFPTITQSNAGNSEKQLLSVVIPYYNMGRYVEETIASVFQSDYSPFEVIVVNDGSDDENSNLILKKIQATYSIRVINQENNGLSAARNAGAEAAKGEFLAFIDADDKVDSSYYRKAVAILNSKNNVHFVGSWVQYFENSNAVWPAFTPEAPYLLYYNMVCSGALVFRKNSFEQAGLNDSGLEYGLEDWESVISLVTTGRHGVVIPEVLYHYRIRKDSMARKFTEEKILFSAGYISKKHAHTYAAFASELTSLYNSNGPGYRNDNPTLDKNNYGVLPGWIPYAEKIILLIKRFPILKKVAFKIYAFLKN